MRRPLGLAAVAAAAGLAWLGFTRQAPAPNAAAARPAGAVFPWAGVAVPQVEAASAAAVSAAMAVMPAPAPGGPAFRTDAQGRLVLDQAMRLRLEELLALHEGVDLAARIDTELAALPATAAAHARELFTRMEAYQAAQRAAFPPGEAPLVPEEGLAQLAAMQAMRVSHFGAEAAQRMFAQDDTVARRLLELMRDETAASLTMEQKAMRAQARYDLERGTGPR